MVAAPDDFQGITGDAVDQPMLAVDASRPKPGKVALQGFGLADPFERMAQTFLDQPGQPAECRLVGFLPIQELLPSSWLEDQPHSSAIASSSSMVFTIPWPASSSAMPCSSDARLAGEDSR